MAKLKGARVDEKPTLAVQCFAHAVGSSVTRARTTMIERRRKVMADWAAFLAGESVEATVVPFAGKRLTSGVRSAP